MGAPYTIEPFGDITIPKDWLFYTPLARRLRHANNEEALQDLINIISRIRRSRLSRYQGIMGAGITTNMAGTERSLKGVCNE